MARSVRTMLHGLEFMDSTKSGHVRRCLMLERKHSTV